MNALLLADELGSLILMFEDREEDKFLKMAKDCQSMLRKLQAENKTLKRKITSLELLARREK